MRCGINLVINSSVRALAAGSPGPRISILERHPSGSSSHEGQRHSRAKSSLVLIALDSDCRRRRLRPSADPRCGLRPGHGGALEGGADVGARKAGGEEGGDESVARARSVDRLDLWRFGPPAPRARRGFTTRRATLDNDQRVERRKPRALGFRIVGAGENCRFLGIGEQDRGAARPVEKILRPDFAQEFRRRRIDADRLRLPRAASRRGLPPAARERRTNSRRDG